MSRTFDPEPLSEGRIQDAEPVTAPGVPPSYPNPADLITNDCIQPPSSPP